MPSALCHLPCYEKVRSPGWLKAGATVEARYRETVKFQPTKMAEIAVVIEGSAPLVLARSDPYPFFRLAIRAVPRVLHLPPDGDCASAPLVR